MSRLGRTSVVGVVLALALVGCTSADTTSDPVEPADSGPPVEERVDPPRTGEITVAFAGDVHFEAQVSELLTRPRGALGPIARTLRRADVAMLNLETPITRRGSQDPKELEKDGNRFHFRTGPAALEVLADAGVDLVSVANNHAGDYGQVGLADTLAAGRRSDVVMVGAGRNDADAVEPPHPPCSPPSRMRRPAMTSWSSTSTGVWNIRPARASASASSRATSPRPGPTSWSAPMRTC